MSIRGWVYIIVNEAMPNILKIGYSTKDPVLRAKELSGTSNPHPFHVVFDVLVEEPRTVEQAAHTMLASKREGKEWFRCSRAEAVAAIRACAKSVLIEQNHSKEFRPIPNEKPENAAPTHCYYYNCNKLGTLFYKGFRYCDEHQKLMRKQRFEFARSIRNG